VASPTYPAGYWVPPTPSVHIGEPHPLSSPSTQAGGDKLGPHFDLAVDPAVVRLGGRGLRDLQRGPGGGKGGKGGKKERREKNVRAKGDLFNAFQAKNVPNGMKH